MISVAFPGWDIHFLAKQQTLHFLGIYRLPKGCDTSIYKAEKDEKEIVDSGY